MILNRRSVLAFLLVLGASGVTYAQTQAVPDGIYLVTQSEDEHSLALPVLGFDQEELVQRDRLMALEIASADAEFDANLGAPIIHVTLASTLTEPFARLTERRQDQQIAFVVGGVVVVRPHIREPIRDGKLQIGGRGDLDAAAAIADALRRAAAR